MIKEHSLEITCLAIAAMLCLTIIKIGEPKVVKELTPVYFTNTVVFIVPTNSVPVNVQTSR